MDWQITASSSYPQEWDDGCHVKYARPYLDNKLGWCARVKSSSEWLQIDLGTATEVSKLIAVITLPNLHSSCDSNVAAYSVLPGDTMSVSRLQTYQLSCILSRLS